MDEHAGDGLVRHELCVMMQQRGHLDSDSLIGEGDGEIMGKLIEEMSSHRQGKRQ